MFLKPTAYGMEGDIASDRCHLSKSWGAGVGVRGVKGRNVKGGDRDIPATGNGLCNDRGPRCHREQAGEVEQTLEFS